MIKMIIKGRSPTLRHVPRTHRVALDWLFDRINLDSEIQIRYIDTKHQVADIWDGSLALDLWDLVIEVLRMTHGIPKPTQASTRETVAALQSTPKITQVLDQNVDLSNVDQVLSNAHLSEKESQLYIFEDNEAVIKMIIKGRCPTMRHVSRTHRVALDWLFDRINRDPKIKIKYVDTKNQVADTLTTVQFHT